MAWSPETVMTLIECVKAYPSLYAVEDPLYKNKAERERIFKIIAEEVSLKRPGTTHLDVKRKWNVIRATYVTERRKVMQSAASGVGFHEVYRPTLYYYNTMEFLISALQVHPSQNTLKNGCHNLSLDAESSENCLDSLSSNEDSILEIEPEVDPLDIPSPSPCVRCTKMKTPVMTPAKKRRRKDSTEDAANSLRAAISVLAGLNSSPTPQTPPLPPAQDPLTIYGIHVANKLRLLSETEIIEVQFQIDSVIYKALKNR